MSGVVATFAGIPKGHTMNGEPSEKLLTRTYRFKLYPKRASEELLLDYWHKGCTLFNLCVEQRDRATKLGQIVHLTDLYEYQNYMREARKSGVEDVEHPLGQIPRFVKRDEEGKVIRHAELREDKRGAKSIQSTQAGELRLAAGWHDKLAWKPFQAVVQQLDDAWQNFYRKHTKHPPSYRSRHENPSINFPSGSLKIAKYLNSNRILLPQPQGRRGVSGAMVRIKYTGAPEAVQQYLHEGHSKITRDKSGQWWLHILYKGIPSASLFPNEVPIRSVGIDLGITHLVTTSDGQYFPNVRAYGAAEANLVKTDKAISRLIKTYLRHAGYKNVTANIKRYRREALKSSKGRALLEKRNRQHIKVKRQRRLNADVVVNYLTNNYNYIAMEDLNIKGMIKSRLAKQISDASWGIFKERLAKRCKDRGIVLEFVPAAFTSQTCNVCGHKEKNNRCGSKFLCLKCGHNEDADVNAARNILERGQGAQLLTQQAA